jgi:hypothetical protein
MIGRLRGAVRPIRLLHGCIYLLGVVDVLQVDVHCRLWLLSLLELEEAALVEHCLSVLFCQLGAMISQVVHENLRVIPKRYLMFNTIIYKYFEKFVILLKCRNPAADFLQD